MPTLEHPHDVTMFDAYIIDNLQTLAFITELVVVIFSKEVFHIDADWLILMGLNICHFLSQEIFGRYLRGCYNSLSYFFKSVLLSFLFLWYSDLYLR